MSDTPTREALKHLRGMIEAAMKYADRTHRAGKVAATLSLAIDQINQLDAKERGVNTEPESATTRRGL